MYSDYASLAQRGMPAAELANVFIEDHFNGATPQIPVNPFQVLRDLGVPFSFRNFSKCEGMYIPSEDEDDIPVIGINADRSITRQRFTAAHELCHHIKDARIGRICALNDQSDIERYAESFAAALLMPRNLLNGQVEQYAVNGKVSLDDALRIADYFGVSFAACVNQLAYVLHVLDGDIDPAALRQRRSAFGPMSKRAELGMNELLLYRQLYDAGFSYLKIEPTPQTRQIFETKFVYCDSRMEGISIDQEQAAEIVVDLRLKGANSTYCKESSQNIIEVAGLVSAYEWVFENAPKNRTWSIYDVTEINRALFSTARYPEYAGAFRQSNTLVLGGKFETIDYRRVPEEMHRIGREVDELLANSEALSPSAYIEKVLDMHHELTIVHPFRDGNGRSLRAFVNLLFLKQGLPPVLFSNNVKDDYKNALGRADTTGSRLDLYELYYKEMLKAHAAFTGGIV